LNQGRQLIFKTHFVERFTLKQKPWRFDLEQLQLASKGIGHHIQAKNYSRHWQDRLRNKIFVHG
jgi:hypothetical protein